MVEIAHGTTLPRLLRFAVENLQGYQILDRGEDLLMFQEVELTAHGVGVLIEVNVDCE